MRFDFVVPFAMEFVAFDRYVGEFFIGDFDSRLVRVFVKLGANAQTRLGCHAADQVHYDLASQQRAASPVVGDVAEHSMLDLVPLAGAGREVTDLHGKPKFISKLLQLQSPQSNSIAVAATAVGGDQ